MAHAESISEELTSLRRSVGAWLDDTYGFVRIAGPDACSWLHSQTTNDVEALSSGEGQASAVLDRQGRVQAFFTVHRWQDEYWLLIERIQVTALLTHLEAHLFIEEVTLEDATESVEQVLLQGPHVLPLLDDMLREAPGMLGLFPEAPHGCHPVELLGFEVLAFLESRTGEDGFVFVVETGVGEPLLAALTQHGEAHDLRVISTDTQDTLRIEAGLPRFPNDVDDTSRIPETTLERDGVSYEKGCYIGQEVVARLKAYGSVKRYLMGLTFPTDAATPDPGTAILLDDKRIGELRSATYSPTLNAPIALAYLDRDHRVPNTTLSIKLEGGVGETEATVVMLPFVQMPTREQRAQRLYDDALDRFERDLDDEDASAIPLLQQALVLRPAFEDAYEVLGVILHRHQRLDEAITAMQTLAKLNPDCLMAHTNLSVFYLAKGMIEEAEQEKAKAAVLGIQHASDERRAKELAEAERQRLSAEAQERIEMFREVLEIDPDDPVATFGLGKAYIQLHRYEEAIPHLEHACQVQQDFSAAYLDHAKCLEFTDQQDAALNVYRQGIAIASRKGDLMPMREMERRLKALETEAGAR